jgi:hypothetical protein
MDGTRPQHPLTDSQLDRDLESALGIEPSPEFLARVRTRVAAEPDLSAWRLAVRGRGLQPVVVMALAAVVLAVVVPNVMRNVKRSAPDLALAIHKDVPVRGRVGVNPGRVEPAAREEVPPAAHERILVPLVRRVEADVYVGLSQTAQVHTLPLQLSPVMFSEEDRIAFASFVTAVGDGRVPEKVIQSLGEEDRMPLAIAPLVINPLPPLARMERQGEGQW